MQQFQRTWPWLLFGDARARAQGQCVSCAQLIRAVIQAATNVTPPDAPPPPQIEAYGDVALTQQGSLLSQVPKLVAGAGIYSKTPLPMEEYGQQ